MSKKEIATYKKLIEIKREKLHTRCTSRKEENEIRFLIDVLEDLIKAVEV